MVRIVKTPSWSRQLFSSQELAGFEDTLGIWGTSFWLVPGRGVVFNDSQIRRRKLRKLRQRRIVEKIPAAVPFLSTF